MFLIGPEFQSHLSHPDPYFDMDPGPKKLYRFGSGSETLFITISLKCRDLKGVCLIDELITLKKQEEA